MRIRITTLKRGKNTLEEENNRILGTQDGIQPVGPVHIRATVCLEEDSIWAQFSANVDVELACSRCLEPFSLTLKGRGSVLFTWKDRGVEGNKGDTSLQRIPPDQTDIDMSSHIRESLILEIPMKPECSATCKGLCSVCGTNFNHQGCDCGSASTDPRWNKLAQMKW